MVLTPADFLKNPFASAILCFTAGCLASLSMPPSNVWLILFLGLPILYGAILYSRNSLIASAMGWLFGFGYFLLSLSWIGNALLVDGNPYKWAWLLAVSGLPAFLAFFPALACALSKKFLSLEKLTGWIGFIGLLSLSEWLRGHLFTGFPWNLFGYAWSEHLPILQILRFSDVYFLTGITCFWALIPAAFFLKNRKASIICAVAGILSFGLFYGYGTWRLQAQQENRDDTVIRLVQPNIAQADKWDRDKLTAHFKTHIELSQNRTQTAKRTIVIWPETALSHRVISAPQTLPAITSMLRSYPEGSALLTGLLRYNSDTHGYENTLISISQNGKIPNIYSKHHLVPFGEYIPFQKWIPLAPVTQFKGLSAGHGPQTYAISEDADLHYSPLICYEIIFPNNSIAQGTHPDFIVNITNDAWYGDSAGPYQHFAHARYRAIETGTPVIRAANTGISAVISPEGRVFGKTDLFQPSGQTLSLPLKRPVPRFIATLKPLLPPILFCLCIASSLPFVRLFSATIEMLRAKSILVVKMFKMLPK